MYTTDTALNIKVSKVNINRQDALVKKENKIKDQVTMFLNSGSSLMQTNTDASEEDLG